MNKQAAQLLEQHFDTAFAAPDGIAKLRELILTLAMQGKLVEQDPNDPPASELLKEIEAERKRGSHEGTKTRRKEKLPPIKPEEVPYKLPQGWEWVRLGELFRVTSGAVSTSKCNTRSMPGGIGLIEAFEHGSEYSQRRGEVMHGTRPIIEAVGNRIKFLLRVDRQVRPLGQVLAQQAVGILA